MYMYTGKGRMNMNILKLCLVAVLVFWLISEFASEDVSAVTSMLGIAVAVVAMIIYNKKHSRSGDPDSEEPGDYDEDDPDYDAEDYIDEVNDDKQGNGDLSDHKK